MILQFLIIYLLFFYLHKKIKKALEINPTYEDAVNLHNDLVAY